MNIGTIENDNDNDKNNEIDNEEKLKPYKRAYFSPNNVNNLERNYNSNYADITPSKNEIDEDNYMNYFNSIDTSASKLASSKSKDIDYSKKDYNKKDLKGRDHSYNKQKGFVKKLNTGTENNKFLFNNFAMYNSNRINSEKSKKKSKSKKIKVINLPIENEYHYTNSSNAFNTVKNKLNKSSISNRNYNRTIDTSHNKILNKSRNTVSFDKKKNNSVRRIKMNSDINKDIIMNKLIGKKNMDKSKVNRANNRSLNYTFDKTYSNKSKKDAPKMKNIKIIENIENIENEENIDDQQNQENQEIKQQEEDVKKEEKKIRMIDKIGCICHAGEISYGKPKINQDNYFNYKINTDDLVFVGVCDGHGENGHYVSEYLINRLPQDFNETYNDLKQKEQKEFDDISLESITKTFEEAFLKTDNDLNEFCDNMKKRKLTGENVDNYFNCDYSGSTCVSILLKQNDVKKVYIANVGDSRTIVIREKDNNWTCKQLSRDHKPTEKDEYNRIIEADGEIEAIEDDNGNWTGPLRVWEKGSEGPGLAMTRSLGDKVGSKIGVVCTPEVFKYFIKEEDRAFIIASDGLWEYMNNQDVTNSVKELITNMRNNNENNEINADIITKELFNQSIERWRKKEQGIDDITIICVLLK
jgi:serine/threonine protein phosphatase PrpC